MKQKPNRLLLWVLFYFTLTGFTNNLFAQYCIPTSTYGPLYDTFIDGVELNNISNTGTGSSTGPNYNDYTSQIAVLDTVSQNELIVTVGPYYLNMWYYAWIDYNHDSDFYDAGELLGLIQATSAGQHLSIFFTVPEGALSGPTRLRVTCVYNVTNQDPCGAYEYGETEDYTVTTPGFTDIGIGIIGYGYSNSEWGDYDNDGDLDILFPTSSYTQVYRNDGNDNFTLVNVDMAFVEDGDKTWEDYDNDGDLDVAVTGRYGIERITVIYRNDGGDIFTDIGVELIGVKESSCAWGDYNGDGRPDLIVSGLDATDTPVAVLYRNDGNDIFSDTEIDITPGIEGDIEWGDIDNDENLDLLITGLDFNGNEKTEIYRNDGKGHFIAINAGFPGNFRGDVEFGDYDNDGDLDVASSGQNNPGRIFRNDGDLSFTDIGVSFPYLNASSISWGDYDLDGDLDLFYCGSVSYISDKASILYENQGSDIFVELYCNIPPVSGGSATWGDYDNDKDLDLLVTGADTYPGFTKIYRNDQIVMNSPPSTPVGITTQPVNDGAILSWSPSNDNQTPVASISYNVRVGTSLGANDVLSSMSAFPTGYRELARRGNAGLDTNFYIGNLPLGTYYWSVQAVDNSYIGSAFSVEDVFEVKPSFSTIDQRFLTASSAGFAWGDYDNDGYQDLILCGNDESGLGLYTKIFRNNGDATFDTINAKLPGLGYGYVAWGDYDNDSDLDLLLSGNTSSAYPNYNPITRIYRNDGGSTFIDINAGMGGAGFSNVKWGDIDNDGDLDALVMGDSNSEIYRNDGGDIFTGINAPIPNASHGSLSLGDYDNDLDLDLMVAGSGKTKIYDNTGNGVYILSGIEFPSTNEGSVTFGDVDNDNNLDVLFVGEADYFNSVRIYRNNGDGVFNDIEASIRGVSESMGAWGDFNNDGFSDILYTGRSGSFITKIYMNEKNYEFSDLEANLYAYYRGKVGSADFDNDGDLDVFISNYSDSSFLYQNNMNFQETLPTAPSSLQSENFGKGVILCWARPSDVPDGEVGLSYNIRLGSSSLSADVISPMTLTPTSTKRLVPEMGNAQLNTSWRIDSLPVGDYYWSVQAITPSFRGGEWSFENSFTITQMRPFLSSDTVCLGDSTSFTDETIVTGTQIASWLWEFGDGNTSTLQHPKHLYEQPGNFDATLTVTDTAGVFLNKTNPVYVLPRPVANFSISDICIGSMASVVNISDTDTLNIAGWLWDYGDGSTSTLQHPGPYGYLNTGIYEITLSVLAQNGCVDSVKNPISVAEYPVSNIAAGGNPEFCEGDSVKLSVPENSSYIYQWKVGGVPVADADSSVYLAYSSGNYTVSVTNQVAGCNSESLTPITVLVSASPSPPLIQSNGPITFCKGDSVVLSVTDNTDYTYQWKLNGGAIGIDTNVYIAKSSGNYILEVSNSTGCVALSSNSVDITVNDIPAIPSINLSGPTSFCAGDSVIISVTNNTAYTYQWKNEFGNITGLTTNEITVKETGTYYLAVSNSSNCSVETEPVIVTVSESPSIPVIVYSGSTTFCNGDSIQLSVTNNTSLDYQWKLNTGAIGIDTNIYYAKSSGNYILEVSNTAGCVALSSNSVDITVSDIPDTPSVNLKSDV
ncbi:MAG: FG-GAP-like repeat-containing protein, partial [Bacteroidales bacterium]|nr:FG-GAP-like repeat-containing protein [Bacteroidales bacterium]